MSSNPYASKKPRVYDSGIPKDTEVSDTTVAAKEVAENVKSEVPAGSIKEVKDWVGEDLERAKTALDAENEGAQRTTLISYLTELLSD